MTISHLPHTISPELLSSLRSAVGEDGVLTEEADLAEYRDPYWIPGDRNYAGAVVVCPTSVEQVQEVVRIANAHATPIWTHSQGRNNGYGGASPRVAGSIQLSLRQMNRVLEINEELAYAVVEPGVRWFDLYEALQAGGHRLRVSVPDLGWGSVIGNSMDNGITYMPNGADHTAPTGFEVVLPDGELLRTGMGALPDSKAWHLYKRSLGPSLDPLFTQSNFGIVTKMGVWLQRTPAAYQSLILSIDSDGQLENAIDALRELMLDGTVRGVPSMYPSPTHGPLLMDLPSPPPQLWDDEKLDEYGRETGLGRWAVRVGLWDDPDVVELKAAKIARVWGEIPGSAVHAGRVYTPEEYDQITMQTEMVHIGIPTMTLMENIPEWVGHVGFSPVVPLEGGHIRKVVDHMSKRFAEHDIPFTGGILCISARAATVVAGVQFVTEPDAVRNAFEVSKQLVREIGQMGYGEYRAHLDFMDAAADQYSFNNHSYRRFVQKIKDAIDPNGILSPGRHGVWPRNYRGEEPE